jgi:Zn finger protein HypA/HybF involved in hydrogenase expression
MLTCHCQSCGKLFSSQLSEEALRCEECESPDVEVLAGSDTLDNDNRNDLGNSELI